MSEYLHRSSPRQNTSMVSCIPKKYYTTIVWDAVYLGETHVHGLSFCEGWWKFVWRQPWEKLGKTCAFLNHKYSVIDLKYSLEYVDMYVYTLFHLSTLPDCFYHVLK